MTNSNHLTNDELIHIYQLMLQSRLLEEHLINMFKKGHGFFWIGGPGEEAFNVPLGLLIKKGRGLDYDFLHFHYRANAIALAMGMDVIDTIRQMRNTATDQQTGGRNFCGHLSMPEFNLTPITSPVGSQFVTAIGTGIAQRDHGGDAITIVTGGDAGTAEGDFASCLIWASRPQQELPILIVITNNQKGISTHYNTQHGEKHIADRAKAFGIENKVINGNDPIIAYHEIKLAMDYVRTTRKPFLLEANVSRLYGHSSASGANFQAGDDPLTRFRDTLKQRHLITDALCDTLTQQYIQHLKTVTNQVLTEPMPDPRSIYDHIYATGDPC